MGFFIILLKAKYEQTRFSGVNIVVLSHGSALQVRLSLPLSVQLLLDVAVKEAEKAQGCGGLHLPVELLHDDLLHPHHVRHGKAILTDADEFVG